MALEHLLLPKTPQEECWSLKTLRRRVEIMVCRFTLLKLRQSPTRFVVKSYRYEIYGDQGHCHSRKYATEKAIYIYTMTLL